MEYSSLVVAERFAANENASAHERLARRSWRSDTMLTPMKSFAV